MIPEPSALEVLLITSALGGVALVVGFAGRALVAWFRRRRELARMRGDR